MHAVKVGEIGCNHYFKTVVVTGGFCPQGIFGYIWKHLWLSRQGGAGEPGEGGWAVREMLLTSGGYIPGMMLSILAGAG